MDYYSESFKINQNSLNTLINVYVQPPSKEMPRDNDCSYTLQITNMHMLFFPGCWGGTESAKACESEVIL